MNVIFFYGITFDQNQCRRRLLFKNVEACQPSAETVQGGGFDPDRWYSEFLLDEGIDHLETQLEKASDPILIGSLHSNYEVRFYIGIRDTYRTGDNSFELEKVEKEEWDLLLRLKCDELGIQWETPQFHLMSAIVS